MNEELAQPGVVELRPLALQAALGPEDLQELSRGLDPGQVSEGEKPRVLEECA